MTREEILDDEFVRAKPPGLRLVTPGLLKLFRKVGLRVLRTAQAADAPPHPMEWPAVCFLMDERHPLGQIRETADRGPAFLDSAELAGYDFEITPLFLLRVKEEISRTNRALEALAFEIENKPGGREGPQPAGKSSSPPGS